LGFPSSSISQEISLNSESSSLEIVVSWEVLAISQQLRPFAELVTTAFDADRRRLKKMSLSITAPQYPRFASASEK